MLLNRFGRVGPVPEGMSAATALRADKYRHEHEALAARVLILAEAFRGGYGYQPPYWELQVGAPGLAGGESRERG